MFGMRKLDQLRVMGTRIRTRTWTRTETKTRTRSRGQGDAWNEEA